MNEKKRLIKNTGIIAIGSFSTKIVSFLLLPLYTSLLSTNEYGEYDYIICICTFVLPFITFLMEEGIFRFLLDCKTDQEKKKVISIGTGLVAFGVAIFILVCAIIFKIREYEYAIYFVIYTVSCVGTAIINPVLRGIGDVTGYAVFNFLLGAITVVLNVIFIAGCSWGLFGMLLATIIAHIGVVLIMGIKIKIWQYWDFKAIDSESLKTMLRYSIPLIPNKISWSIINLCDRIMIMNIIGSSASGLYAISYKFPNLMDLVYGFFYQSWKESSARVLEDDNKDVFYNSVYKALKRFMIAIVIGMTAFMPLVYKILIDESYNDSLKYVPILLIATYFANISGFYGGIFTAYKDTKIMGTTTILAALINLVVNIIFIPTIGIWAAALSTLIANYVVYVYRKIKVRKYIKLEEEVGFNICFVFVLALVLVLFYSNVKYSILLACIISVIFAVVFNKKIITSVLNKVLAKKGN